MWKFLNLLFCLCWGVIILRLLHRNRQLFEKPGAVWIPLLAVFCDGAFWLLLLLFSRSSAPPGPESPADPALELVRTELPLSGQPRNSGRRSSSDSEERPAATVPPYWDAAGSGRITAGGWAGSYGATSALSNRIRVRQPGP